MRMPFMEFIGGGDPKFMIAFAILFILVIIQLIRKRKLVSMGEDQETIEKTDNRIKHLSSILLMLSVISLLLGFLHSFYFIGQMEGVSPKLLYSGVSRTLISPTLGLILYTISKILIAVSGSKLTPART